MDYPLSHRYEAGKLLFHSAGTPSKAQMSNSEALKESTSSIQEPVSYTPKLCSKASLLGSVLPGSKCRTHCWTNPPNLSLQFNGRCWSEILQTGFSKILTDWSLWSSTSSFSAMSKSPFWPLFFCSKNQRFAAHFSDSWKLRWVESRTYLWHPLDGWPFIQCIHTHTLSWFSSCLCVSKGMGRPKAANYFRSNHKWMWFPKFSDELQACYQLQ